MLNNSRYPKIYIRSKNDLSKHLHHGPFSQPEALKLINEVLANFDSYWKDNKKQSEPGKGKFVRNAKGTKLGKLLDLINKRILAPCDHLLPEFIFGGVTGKNHVQATAHLIGNKRRRVALKMDIKGFFETIGRDRVYDFFRYKCQCDGKSAMMLANLCCVPLGEKGSGSSEKTIGRGFATSSRLAIWCNLDAFIQVSYLMKKKLKNNDPRLAIYVDDIGITASGVSKMEMEDLVLQIKDILLNHDKKQPLPINDKKTKVSSHEEGIYHLGINVGRNKLTIGKKSRSKQDRMKHIIKTSPDFFQKKLAKKKLKSMRYYRKYVETAHLKKVKEK